MIVSLSGSKRAGKDSCADVLISKFKFTKIALADPLRNLCSKVFEIPIDTFLSDELKEKQFERPVFLNESHLGHIQAIIEHEWGFDVTEKAHNSMMEFIGVGFAHPRQILQTVGTEIIRGSIDDEIFLKIASKRIESITGNVVVSDVRFKAERDFMRNLGATMCLIKRPHYQQKHDKHISENELGDESEYGIVMLNDSELSVFQHDVYGYFSEILKRREY